ncbi:MAG: TraR/DksA family transcriptional regulator [Pseudomonadales bacterium]|nr:TraR/DksA family transcriptional regulator [Pseudomonadales bacterium]
MSTYKEIIPLLLAKKEEIEARLRRTDKHIHHRDEPLSADFSEQASEVSNFEVMIALDKEGKEEISQINAALGRIESGKYDECSACGTSINKKRLEAIPYTTYCLACSDKAQA